MRREYLGVAGWSEAGDFVLFPNSYRQGYSDALTLDDSERRRLVSDWLVVGALSDGTIVYPPSYRRGVEYGIQRGNELKFSILAENGLRQANENRGLVERQEQTERTLGQALERIRELENKITDAGDPC